MIPFDKTLIRYALEGEEYKAGKEYKSGGRVYKVKRAYRIFEENETMMKVREVKTHSELEAILWAVALWDVTRAVL